MQSQELPHAPPSYWRMNPGLPPPSSDLPATAEVAVIGAGLLGAATGYWLARAGAQVVLIERDLPASGATGHNGGFVVAGTAERYPAAQARLGQATTRAVWELTIASRELLREVLAEERIDCDYREPGHLTLALDAAQLDALAATASALRADGVIVDLLDRSAAQTLIDTPLGPEISGGLFAPEQGLLHPVKLVQGLVAAACRHGARLSTTTPVVELRAEGDTIVVRTTGGELRAGAIVVAANAWLGRIVPGLAQLVVPVRGQVLAYAPVAPVFRVGLSAALTPTGEYWQQAPDGTIVLGGCRAAAPDADVGVTSCAPTAEVQAALETVFPQLFPRLGGLRVTQRWAGLMAFTPDYLPIADRAPGLPGVWVVGGFCGHGMPFGMRLGQLIAEAVLSGGAPVELAPFRIGRKTIDPVLNLSRSGAQ